MSGIGKVSIQQDVVTHLRNKSDIKDGSIIALRNGKSYEVSIVDDNVSVSRKRSTPPGFLDKIKTWFAGKLSIRTSDKLATILNNPLVKNELSRINPRPKTAQSSQSLILMSRDEIQSKKPIPFKPTLDTIQEGVIKNSRHHEISEKASPIDSQQYKISVQASPGEVKEFFSHHDAANKLSSIFNAQLRNVSRR